MKKIYRIITAFVLAAALVFSLAGCKGNSPNGKWTISKVNDTELEEYSKMDGGEYLIAVCRMLTLEINDSTVTFIALGQDAPKRYVKDGNTLSVDHGSVILTYDPDTDTIFCSGDAVGMSEDHSLTFKRK